MAWQVALAELDAWTAALIVVAAGIYAGALVAAGSVLFSLAFPELSQRERRTVFTTLAVAAWTCIALLLLQWPLQAGYLGGGNLDSALDPTLLVIVFEGAAGNRLVLALAGLVLVQAILTLNRRHPVLGHLISLAGIGLILLAFAQVGHTTGEPRLVLSSLLALHLLAIAFWIGSLMPLYQLAGSPSGHGHAAHILARFGQIAAVAVGTLILAGLALAGLLLGGIPPLIGTAYGQFLLAKLALIALLLLLAAGNKWRLVPAFERGDRKAPGRLRRSIGAEMLMVIGILLVTATMVTVSSPGGG